MIILLQDHHIIYQIEDLILDIENIQDLLKEKDLIQEIDLIVIHLKDLIKVYLIKKYIIQKL